MSYQALYRKWRPTRFEEVSGQEHITHTLKKQIESGKTGHAYLFTGTRGTGKTTCAKIMAKALNCLESENGEPCGKCMNCQMAETDTLYDIVEIDAASKSKVEDVRKLIDEVMFAPSVGRFKVYIVDEVHMMTGNAFNALLKTLEEPPSHTVFILATTEVQKVPATILSRCQRFDFKRLSSDIISNRLTYIAEQDHINLKKEAADYLGILADGALRDGLSLLEQCQTYDTITVDTVKQLVGIAGIEDICSILMAAKEKNYSKILSEVDRLYKDSKKMENLIGELVDACKDMLLIKLNSQSIISRTIDEIKALNEVASNISEQVILYWIDVLTDALSKTTKNNGNKTLTEIALIKMCDPKLSCDYSSLNVRLTALENSEVRHTVKETVIQPVEQFVKKEEEVVSEELPCAVDPIIETVTESSGDIDKKGFDLNKLSIKLKEKLNSNPATMSIAAFLPDKYEYTNGILTFYALDFYYTFLNAEDIKEKIKAAADDIIGSKTEIKIVKV